MKRCLCQKATGAPRCAVCPLPETIVERACRLLDGRVVEVSHTQLGLDLAVEEKLRVRRGPPLYQGDLFA